MQVTITRGLLEAIERAADTSKTSAYSLENSKEYRELPPHSGAKELCDRGIEQQLQDYDVLLNWSKRVREQHNIRG